MRFRDFAHDCEGRDGRPTREADAGVTPDARHSEHLGSLPPGDLVEMLDRLSDGILVLDRDWRIRYINQPVGEMVGRSHEELLGQRLWDEFPEAIGGPFHLAYEEALETGSPQRVVELYEPLDSWFETRIFPQQGELVVLLRDVTDEQRVEHDLREYVDGIAEAERIVRFGVWRWDVASGRVRWSDELHRIYGLRPGEFEGTADAFVERVHPDDREQVRASVSRSLETLEPFVFRERVVRGDGVERTLRSQGRVIVSPDGSAEALVGVCHDVTDRAKVEQALGVSEERMRAIVDKTPSMICVKDLDGRYVMSNAEFERVMDVSPAELAGKRCADLLPPEIAEPQREIDRRAASEGEPVYGETAMDSDGEQRSYVTVTFPLPDEDGVPAETCTIATDVTERRERESERRERLAWTDRICSALEEDRLVAFAQPIVAADGGEQLASELLVRMRAKDDRFQLVAPRDFLPAAERYELIQSIDTVTMCDPEARRQIVELLRAAPEGTRRTVFEITETADMVQLGRRGPSPPRSPRPAAASPSTTSASASAPSPTSARSPSASSRSTSASSAG